MILALGRPYEYHQSENFLKYLNVFTQLDIQFQADLFSSYFQVIYKCVSLLFLMHFIFQIWILKPQIAT